MEVAIGWQPSVTTGASLRQTIQGPGINWAKVNRTVRRLQVRIVKAIQQGKSVELLRSSRGV